MRGAIAKAQGGPGHIVATPACAQHTLGPLDLALVASACLRVLAPLTGPHQMGHANA